MAGDRVLTVKIAGDAKGAVGAIGQVEGKTVGLGKKLLAMGGLFAGINVGQELVADIARVGMAYEKSMNVLQATSRATDAQMDKVRETARALGSDMSIPATSASQASGAMLELTKGGLSLADSMDAARGTLLLAAAASVDGATAAEIQANAIAQFNLKAGDAARVADVLANVANSATGDITDVAGALSYVGPVAASVSMSIDQTATAIGVMAQQSIVGQKAGTALRGILAGMANPSKKAAEAMKALGVTAYDAQGNFVGMRKVTAQLARAKGRLTEQEFAAASAAAFGREPLAAINALASEGVTGWDKMAKAVGREGSAAEVAKSKNKGFGGAVDRLQSQLEDLYIVIWEKVAPGLGKIVDKAAKAVGWFSDLSDKSGNLSDALNNIDGAKLGEKLAGAFETALDKIGGFAGKIGSKIGKLIGDIDWVSLGIEMGKAAVPMLVGLALGILNFDIGALLAGLAANWEAVLMGILSLAFMPAKWAAKLAQWLGKIPFVGKLLSWIVKSVNKIGKKIQKFGGKIVKKFTGGFKDAMGWASGSMIGRLVKFFKRMWKKITKWAKDTAKRFGEAAENMAERFGKWLANHGPKQAARALGKLKDRIFRFFAPAARWLLDKGRKVLDGLVNGIKRALGLIGRAGTWVKDKVTGIFGGAGRWLWDAGSNIIRGLLDGIGAMVQPLRDKLSWVTDMLPDWKGPPERDRTILTPAGEKVMRGFEDGLSSRFGNIKAMLGGFTSDMEKAATESVRKGASGSRGFDVRASRGLGAHGPHRPRLRGSQGSAPVYVYVTVEGNVIGERDFAKRVTPTVRDELVKIGSRNGGRIFGESSR